MTERVQRRLDAIRSKEYRKHRLVMEHREKLFEGTDRRICQQERWAYRFRHMVENEKPILHEDDLFGFNQYRTKVASFDRGGFSNITPDYETLLAVGLEGLRAQILEKKPTADLPAKAFYRYALSCIDAAERYVDSYREAAKAAGATELYEALCVVPEHGAENYYQAMVSLRFLQATLRLNHIDHVTLGRYDQYMRPYFEASRKAGQTDEELLELTELFFLSLNVDTDIYFGIQQGDNGQSMVLGGCDPNGNSAYNDLTEICLMASEELKLIDPKINLRVTKDTPLSLYERGTRLTKQGLGFPQYLNDDIIIPGLVALGYDLEDARNYSVAACWEPIIPAYGAEVPNKGAFDYPKVISRAAKRALADAKSYEEFLETVEEELEAEAYLWLDVANRHQFPCDPYLSLFIRPCIERGRTYGEGGAKYTNFGSHGVGIATAADSLEAIERAVFVDKIVTGEELVRALEHDFVGYEDLQKKLLAYPKMGNNEDSVDDKAAYLMGRFVALMGSVRTTDGAFIRPGTGSALEYVNSSLRVGATADGRKAGQPYGANFSPSVTARLNGPLSAVISFTKTDLTKIINGGPFTIEIHDTVFRNAEGEKKVAMLVQAFIQRGGHQIQINSVNRDQLLDAQKHPENYPNLIVRVWGWSGYFVELDLPYQNHVISRTEFMC
ncbi:MAG: pyruvate formate-lyase [Clostridia bacterium]|nr:pyruvate formate-lyase [Clostridia bacterium]